MKVPKDCPLKLKGNVNQPVSCPCYNKQDCDVVSKVEASPEDPCKNLSGPAKMKCWAENGGLDL